MSLECCPECLGDPEACGYEKTNICLQKPKLDKEEKFAKEDFTMKVNQLGRKIELLQEDAITKNYYAVTPDPEAMGDFKTGLRYGTKNQLGVVVGLFRKAIDADYILEVIREHQQYTESK